jgi:hypothetical protein
MPLGSAPAGGHGMQKYFVDGEATFDPDTILVLSKALDDAWRSLQHTGVFFRSRHHVDETREKLARYILQAATLGERDPNRLRDDALLKLSQSNLAQLRPREPAL